MSPVQAPPEPSAWSAVVDFDLVRLRRCSGVVDRVEWMDGDERRERVAGLMLWTTDPKAEVLDVGQPYRVVYTDGPTRSVGYYRLEARTMGEGVSVLSLRTVEDRDLVFSMGE